MLNFPIEFKINRVKYSDDSLILPPSPEILLVRTKSVGTDLHVQTNGRFSNLEISTGNKRVRINESSLYTFTTYHLPITLTFDLEKVGFYTLFMGDLCAQFEGNRLSQALSWDIHKNLSNRNHNLN